MASQDRYAAGYTGYAGVAGERTAPPPGGGAGEARSAARETLNEARRYGEDVAGRAQEQGRTLLGRQKDVAAERVHAVAEALRASARQLDGDASGDAGRYAGMAAERLEALGRQLREKDVDSLIDEAQAFARRSPAVFFGGSIAAGFLLARFLKSSGQRSATNDPRYAGQGRRTADRAAAATPAGTTGDPAADISGGFHGG